MKAKHWYQAFAVGMMLFMGIAAYGAMSRGDARAAAECGFLAGLALGAILP